MKHKAVRLLTVAMLLAFATCRTVAEAPPGDRGNAIVLYDSSSASQAASGAARQHALREIASGALGGPEAWSAHASVAFRMQTRTLWDAAPLRVGTLPRSPQKPGWRADEGIVTWLGDGAAVGSRISLPLAIDPAQQPGPFGQYDELWADILTVPPIAPCAIQVELGFDGGGSMAAKRSVVARSGQVFVPRVVADMHPARSAWIPKDLWYVAGRLLGVDGDEQWRYSSYGGWAVLQRRADLPIEDVEAIDVSLAPGVTLHQINLRIASRDRLARSEIFEFGSFGPAPTLPDGRSGVRLKVREALEKRLIGGGAKGSGPDKPYALQEIVIFLPGEARVTVEAAPVRRIAFVGAATDLLGAMDQAQHITLPSKLVGYGADRQRLVVDLRPLRERGELKLREGALQIIPTPSIACAVRPDQVQVVKPFADSIPQYAVRLEEAAKRSGDVIAARLQRRGRVEYPEVLAHLPFSALAAADTSRDSSDYLLRLGPNRDAKVEISGVASAPSPYRVLAGDGREVVPERSRMAASNGALATFEGPMPNVTPVERGVYWEGHFRKFEVSWPVHGALPDTAWFYFAVPEGAESIARLTLVLESIDGKSFSRAVAANRAQKLIAGSVPLRGARLRGVMANSATAAKLKIEGITLFAPKDITFEEAFSAALPIPLVATPVPQFPSGTEPPLLAHAGQVVGLFTRFSDRDLHFTTAIDPGLTPLKGVRVRYRFPAALLDVEPCALAVRFNGTAATLERGLCMEEPTGEVFIPFARFAGVPMDLGELRSIDWTIRTSRAPVSAKSEAFDLMYSVDGWAIVSAAQALSRSTLLDAGRTPVRSANAITAMSPGGYLVPMSIPIEPEPLWRMARSFEDIHLHQLDSYAVEQVVLVPGNAAPRYSPVPPMPVAQALPRWRQWSPWLALATVACLVWLTRSRWRPPVVTRVRGVSHAARRGARALLSPLASLGRRQCAQASTLFAIAACAAGLWLSGRMEWSFPSAMLIFAVAIVAWGARLHWDHATEDISLDSPATRAIAGAAAACAIWAFGRYGASTQTLWAGLPVAALLYALAPLSLRPILAAARDHRGSLGAAAWTILALALYAAGAVSPPSGENYYFTFAGVAVVLAWRALALALQRRVRTAFPAAGARVYEAPAGVYLSGALFALLLTALALLVKSGIILEQLATVMYYFMVVALVRQAWALRKARDAAIAEK
jgi:hypothetical protein